MLSINLHFRFSLTQDGSSTNPDHYVYANFENNTASAVSTHKLFTEYIFKDIGASPVSCPRDDPIDVITFYHLLLIYRNNNSLLISSTLFNEL